MAELRSMVAALLLSPAVALAMVVPMSLEDLASQSDVIVHGEVAELQSWRTPDRSAIYTDVTIQILELVRSRVTEEEPGETLTVRIEGGKVGDEEMRTSVSPILEEGQQGLFFLAATEPGQPYWLVGGMQGWLAASDGVVELAGTQRNLRELISEIRR